MRSFLARQLGRLGMLAVTAIALAGVFASVTALDGSPRDSRDGESAAAAGPIESPSNLPYRAWVGGLAADEVAPVPLPRASGPMPVPILVVRGTERYNDFAGTPYVRYELRVANAHEIPDSFFAGPYSCNPPQVSVINGDTGAYIYGFCGGGENPAAARNALRDVIWFGIPEGVAPPSRVYIKLYDTKTQETFYSTTARLPAVPETSRNEVLSATVENTDCRPSATPGACRSLPREWGAYEVTARITYNYDGTYGPDAQLHATILWVYGTCLVNGQQETRPVFGQPSTVTVVLLADLATVQHCDATQTITDSTYGLLVCLSDGAPHLDRDCKEFPYQERDVTFSRD